MKCTMYTNFAQTVKNDGIEKAAVWAKSLGFSSVEFFEFAQDTWTPCVKDRESARQMKKVLDLHALPVACYSVAVDLYEEGMTPDTVTQKEKALYHYAEMSAELGSPFLHHTLIMKHIDDQLPFEEALRLIVPVAVRVAKYAQSLGVRCIYEDQGRFFNGVEKFGRFLAAVRAECPTVGVCGDVGNILFADGDPVEFFRTYAKDIVHVHIKDYALTERSSDSPEWSIAPSGKTYKECIVGTGCIDLDTCIKIMKDVGYTGAFAFENGPRDVYEKGVAAGQTIISRYF